MSLLIRCDRCGLDHPYDEEEDAPILHRCSSIDLSAGLQPLDFDTEDTTPSNIEEFLND